MSTTNFKRDLFTRFARVAKAMVSANLLELLDFVAQGERSIDELDKISGISIANK